MYYFKVYRRAYDTFSQSINLRYKTVGDDKKFSDVNSKNKIFEFLKRDEFFMPRILLKIYLSFSDPKSLPISVSYLKKCIIFLLLKD